MEQRWMWCAREARCYRNMVNMEPAADLRARAWWHHEADHWAALASFAFECQ